MYTSEISWRRGKKILIKLNYSPILIQADKATKKTSHYLFEASKSLYQKICTYQNRTKDLAHLNQFKIIWILLLMLTNKTWWMSHMQYWLFERLTRKTGLSSNNFSSSEKLQYRLMRLHIKQIMWDTDFKCISTNTNISGKM